MVDNVENVPNVLLSIMEHNVVVQLVFLEIHFPVVHYHYNVAIHNVNVMNREFIVPNVVQPMINALVDKNVPKENVELVAVQDDALKDKYVEAVLVLLAVVTIWIVPEIMHVLVENVKIHAFWKMHAEIMQFVVYPSIECFAYVQMVSVVNQPKVVPVLNVLQTMIVI